MSTFQFQLNHIPARLVDHLEKSVESVPHVQSVRVDVGACMVTIEHDGADVEEVRTALREEGFQPRIV
jgi:copper chaperone CopZ